MFNLTCAIALGFIIATFVSIFGDKSLKNKLYQYLSPQERDVFNDIVRERRNIYLRFCFDLSAKI